MSRGQEEEMVKLPNLQGRFRRDTVIVGVALSLLVFEVTFGGGRPSVLTAVTTLLLSPVIMRIDEARRGDNGSKDDK